MFYAESYKFIIGQKCANRLIIITSIALYSSNIEHTWEGPSLQHWRPWAKQCTEARGHTNFNGQLNQTGLHVDVVPICIVTNHYTVI